MGWRFTEALEPYARAVWTLLGEDPVEHTVALSVIERVRAGHRWSDRGRMLFGWYEDGEVRGVVSLTPPYELLLSVVPAETTADLVDALRREHVRVPGVNGDIETVERFVAAWTSATGSSPLPERGMRLHRLGRLQPPVPAPMGRARPASIDDLETTVRWLHEFQAEAEVPATDVESAMRSGIADGRVWFWQDEVASVVALASRTPTIRGVARIAPVYTPPAHRRRGYGAAVTTACTHDALERGAEQVVLFTDLANPTANSMYQRIGYVPVRDFNVVHFTQPCS